jgi:hypothetical protein
MRKALLPLLAVSAYLELAGGPLAYAQNVSVSVTVRATAKPQSDGRLAWVVDLRATLMSARGDEAVGGGV